MTDRAHPMTDHQWSLHFLAHPVRLFWEIARPVRFMSGLDWQAGLCPPSPLPRSAPDARLRLPSAFSTCLSPSNLFTTQLIFLTHPVYVSLRRSLPFNTPSLSLSLHGAIVAHSPVPNSALTAQNHPRRANQCDGRGRRGRQRAHTVAHGGRPAAGLGRAGGAGHGAGGGHGVGARQLGCGRNAHAGRRAAHARGRGGQAHHRALLNSYACMCAVCGDACCLIEMLCRKS